jgi:hypothetical protein
MSGSPKPRRSWRHRVCNLHPCNTVTHALSNAERQARYRARHTAVQPPAPRTPPAATRRTRPQRWRAAVAELVSLQAEYATWFDALPEALRDGATGEALQAIIDLDLDGIVAIEPPRGYGRD